MATACVHNRQQCHFQPPLSNFEMPFSLRNFINNSATVDPLLPTPPQSQNETRTDLMKLYNCQEALSPPSTTSQLFVLPRQEVEGEFLESERVGGQLN